ncbi:MAG TPA: ATP-binding protein [Polyangiaceae bacterium]|nr:ATP-binding protein [Polyangiaceae bacterium]
MLVNLIANAIDAMGEGGTLTLTTARQGDDFVITVGDTGCGIPHHLKERVFEPFFTTRPVGQGTGLGLAIAYALVRKHGGSLELDSVEGRGTVATIRLPQGDRDGKRDASGRQGGSHADS